MEQQGLGCECVCVGSEFRGSEIQLMLMMLGGLGRSLSLSPANTHDAGGFGIESPASAR